ncbi:hypothetical protein H7F15_01400 [Pontibacter sp. Tf4]|uniref:ATP-binding protein n=1 Tax=Pontibacter sp. Tf4 TaxID=2761620 RepID=UPI0016274FE5|nr:ATP-binding protein [Pontibacter sp. Tf4]MBB6609681.1 hypothetical protein [Pontibacter sp. Tf4]
MMFHEHPEQFFPATWVDVVYFPKGEADPEFTEFPKITGPVPSMIQKTLDLLQTNFLRGKIIKQHDQPEAVRVWNYPYAALEEAIVNALYHRDYQVREQVEIRITPASIVILNYGGPDRSIRQEDLESGRIRPRRYRNRRLGDFLKELDLTEGRATGIPTIKRTLEINGSPVPSFRTDDNHTFFEVEIFCHLSFLVEDLVGTDQDNDQDRLGTKTRSEVQKELEDTLEQVLGVTEQKKLRKTIAGIGLEIVKILAYATRPVKRKDILEKELGLSNHTDNVRRYIEPLLEFKLLDRTVKDKLSSPAQQYYTTKLGLEILSHLFRKG